MNATRRLHAMGQSLWLDNITRGLLTSGTLRRYIEDLAVTGLTSNPTIFDNVKPETKLAREEVFGPVIAIIPVDNFEEAIKVANGVEYGLSSSIYTKDIQRMMQYADRVETGMLHVNSPTVGGEAQAPFGGVKATGLGGREMGSTGPEFFCEIKRDLIHTET